MKVTEFFELFLFLTIPILVLYALIMFGCQSYRHTEAEIEYIKRKNHNLNIDISKVK